MCLSQSTQTRPPRVAKHCGQGAQRKALDRLKGPRSGGPDDLHRENGESLITTVGGSHVSLTEDSEAQRIKIYL